MLGRFLLIALAIGATTSIVATGRVTWSLMLSGTVCWAFVPALQVVTALALVRSGPRPVRAREGLAALFAGSSPWSLWVIATGLVLLFFPATEVDLVLLSAVVPAALTARSLHRFAVSVLGASGRRAVLRVAIHQAVTWAIILAYIATVTQLFPRILGRMEP